MEPELSIIITNRNNKDYLGLCLDSIIKSSKNLDKYEIIVVDDASEDGSQDFLKQKCNEIKQLSGLCLPYNHGLGAALNVGVSYANAEYILLTNEDVVFPMDWEETFYKKYKAPKLLASTNLIEPGKYVPVSAGFTTKDFGNTVNEFNYEEFIKFEREIREDRSIKASNGPQLMRKQDYMTVGGCDVLYKGGIVVDTDFFIKWRLAGFDCLRTYNSSFYHFSGKGGRMAGDSTTVKPEFTATENLNLRSFVSKWGFVPYTENGLWTAPPKKIRGIDFNELK